MWWLFIRSEQLLTVSLKDVNSSFQTFSINLKDTFTLIWKAVIICSPPCWWKVGWSSLVHKTFLDLHRKTVSQLSPKQLKKLGIAVKETFHVVVFTFKTSPHPLQLFMKILHICFAVKLQKCFADYDMKWGWEDNDWIFWGASARISRHLNVMLFGPWLLYNCPGRRSWYY